MTTTRTHPPPLPTVSGCWVFTELGTKGQLWSRWATMFFGEQQIHWYLAFTLSPRATVEELESITPNSQSCLPPVWRLVPPETKPYQHLGDRNFRFQAEREAGCLTAPERSAKLKNCKFFNALKIIEIHLEIFLAYQQELHSWRNFFFICLSSLTKKCIPFLYLLNLLAIHFIIERLCYNKNEFRLQSLNKWQVGLTAYDLCPCNRVLYFVTKILYLLSYEPEKGLERKGSAMLKTRDFQVLTE